MGHSIFFKPHYQGLIDFVYVHLKAALGDILIILAIYLITAVILGFKSLEIKINKNSSALIISLGFIFAVIIEKYALNTHRWSYNDLMPIVPIIEVGLTPILQLVVVPMSALYIIKRVN